MNIYLVALVIFVTFVAVPLAVAWWMGHHPPVPLLEIDRAVKDEVAWEEDAMHQAFGQLRGQSPLPRAGRFDADWWPDPGAGYRFAYGQPPYGPWPVDTGPLLILSEKDAANAALEREIPRLCAEAEAKIPPRWR